MDFIIALFNEIIFRPLLNLLVFVFNILPGDDLGVAIIGVTLLIRFILYPLSYKALKSQKKLADLQPQLKEIQDKHKKDKQAQSRAVMSFYKENGVNPFAGCVPFIIQLPILIGLYRVFLIELTPENLTGLYSFVATPQNIDLIFLGFINLAQPSALLAVLTGFAQFLQSKVTFSQRKNIGASQSGSGATRDFQNIMGKQMTYVLPVVMVFIALSFPAGLALYWFVTTLFSFVQQYVINRKMKKAQT